jgi:hypothetical protein
MESALRGESSPGMAKRERDPGDVTECFSRIVAFFEEKERVAKKVCITNRKEKKVTEKCVTASGVATYFENLRIRAE